MTITLEHPKALVRIKPLPNGKKRISVRSLKKSIFIPRTNCETSYPIELIKLILSIKGPTHLCDEIMRDEDSSYQIWLEKAILGYIPEHNFENKRILDFGCGSGSSTMILARMFPRTHITGIDLNNRTLSIAKSRAKHYDFRNVEFLLSLSSTELPKEIENFDYIILNAVYEHLLPNERMILIPMIWSVLKPNGVIFINQLPHRYFPLEVHTTGLPLINYLSDRMALHVARKFSKRVKNNESWESLLRRGIRGGTANEIMKILSEKCRNHPILLKPSRLGIRDEIDLWHATPSYNKCPTLKRLMKLVFKAIKSILNATFVPSLSLAIKKGKVN